MNTFICNHKGEKWRGTITDFKNYGSHYEFWIISRSSIMVMFGKTTRGYFACMPDFNTGCHLVDLQDKFWNTEKLINVLGVADGVTVAFALFSLANILN